jgi:hypothetical protein
MMIFHIATSPLSLSPPSDNDIVVLQAVPGCYQKPASWFNSFSKIKVPESEEKISLSPMEVAGLECGEMLNVDVANQLIKKAVP